MSESLVLAGDAPNPRAPTSADKSESFAWLPTAARDKINRAYHPNRLIPLTPEEAKQLMQHKRYLSELWRLTVSKFILPGDISLTSMAGDEHIIRLIRVTIEVRGHMDPGNTLRSLPSGWNLQMAKRFFDVWVDTFPRDSVTLEYAEKTVRNYFNALGNTQADDQRARRARSAAKKVEESRLKEESIRIMKEKREEAEAKAAEVLLAVARKKEDDDAKQALIKRLEDKEKAAVAEDCRRWELERADKLEQCRLDREAQVLSLAADRDLQRDLAGSPGGMSSSSQTGNNPNALGYSHPRYGRTTWNGTKYI